jgi:hypothetical protein
LREHLRDHHGGGRGRHRGGSREAKREAAHIDARKRKKAAPKDGLFIETRRARSRFDPAISVVEFDEPLPIGTTAKSLLQSIHLTTIPSLFKNVRYAKDR